MNPYDHRDDIIKALVRRIHGLCKPGPGRVVFTAAEVSRAEQNHLELIWDDHCLEVRVTGDT